MNPLSVRVGVIIGALLSLIGWAASALLLQHHLAMEVGGRVLLAGICADTERISCDDVLASPWGTIAGRPTALYGFAFFSFCLAWFLVVGRAVGRRRWLQTLFCLILTAAGGGCVFLAAVMYGSLQKICPLCATTHVACWLLVLLVWWLRRGGQAVTDAAGPSLGTAAVTPGVAAGVSDHPSGRLLLVALVLGAALALGGWSEYGRRREQALATEYHRRLTVYESELGDVYRRFMQQEAHTLVVGPDDPCRGRADARHTIVVFSDFLCPWCRGAARILDDKVRRYPGHFRIVFRHFPMEQTCNPELTRTLHTGACAAAVIAEAARILGGQEAFWQMHDAFYEDQDGFRKGPQEWARQAARKIGLDVDTFWKLATASSGTWQRVRDNVAEARRLGITGTPTVFLDGRRFDRYPDEQFWRYLVFLDEQDRLPPALRVHLTLPTTAPHTASGDRSSGIVPVPGSAGRTTGPANPADDLSGPVAPEAP